MTTIQDILKYEDTLDPLFQLLPKKIKKLTISDEDKIIRKKLRKKYSDEEIINLLKDLINDSFGEEEMSNISNILTHLKECSQKYNIEVSNKFVNSSEISQFAENVSEIKNFFEENYSDTNPILNTCSFTYNDMLSESLYVKDGVVLFYLNKKEDLVKIFYDATIRSSLDVSLKYIYIISPLSGEIIKYKREKWIFDDEFLDICERITSKIKGYEFGSVLMLEQGVGSTFSKEKGNFVETLKIHKGSTIPFQFFLNGTLKTNVTLKEDEIKDARKFMKKNPELRPYCHLPYTLSLANKKKDKNDYVGIGLRDYMETLVKMKILGGVVHVGKYNNYEKEEATSNMKKHILRAIEYASPECPLLLETPSGQGKELLTKLKEFMNFCREIESDSFGICMDTCHVFASGHSPRKYLEKLLNDPILKPKLKLIHFNDSKEGKGSCLDRHAFIGTGCIPKEEFLHITYLANLNNIPMVLE